MLMKCGRFLVPDPPTRPPRYYDATPRQLNHPLTLTLPLTPAPNEAPLHDEDGHGEVAAAEHESQMFGGI